jgi:two-component system, NarL family, response regulator LiaR
MPSSCEGIPTRYTMTHGQLIQVLIADDHTMVRRGLKILLEQSPGIKVVGEAANGLQAIEYVSRLKPDVVLMDLVMPVMNGMEATQRILAIYPDQRIIVLTASFDAERFIQAIKAGAQGYFVKDLSPEELVRAIQNVHQGRPEFDSRFVREIIRRARMEDQPSQLPGQLSAKELGILHLLSHGMTDQEIARELSVSEVTVRTHISRIVRKLGLKNRVQVVLYGLRAGLVPEGEAARVAFNQYKPKQL